MAENSRMSKLSSKDDECVFSWKLFTGWDYMIGELLYLFINRAVFKFPSPIPLNVLYFTYGTHNSVCKIVHARKDISIEEMERVKKEQHFLPSYFQVMLKLLIIALHRLC